MREVSAPDQPPILTVPVPHAVQPVLDEVIHRSVSESTTKHGYMRCADYAIVGARVLSLLTGARYRPIAGGEVMDFGAGNLYVLCTTRERRRTARHLSLLARYHCWIEAEHADAGGVARTEVVDFTLRHDPIVARTLGMAFAGPTNSYFWGWDDEHRVPPQLHDHPAFAKQGPYWRWEERECTSLLRAYERERPAYFSKQVSRALHLFAERIEYHA
ncbi:hypothetical protein Bsp3421_000713 [Burkholderia sp. FERM BP-3421]|uniref:hypothetical protein n=1 Tax=Burkholderia sp. FERM BP-3421 TaxID=1494466 RepID=UPI00235E8464|nr:hypothetical protein [Burkholderia sp. FERM BP-3421]WDD90833.1 hypothetical protein Bsp3421_000713 [Burkholderia sp. FERM BP-3421]